MADHRVHLFVHPSYAPIAQYVGKQSVGRSGDAGQVMQTRWRRPGDAGRVMQARRCRSGGAGQVMQATRAQGPTPHPVCPKPRSKGAVGTPQSCTHAHTHINSQINARSRPGQGRPATQEDIHVDTNYRCDVLNLLLATQPRRAVLLAGTRRNSTYIGAGVAAKRPDAPCCSQVLGPGAVIQVGLT